MKPLKFHSGIVLPLDMANVDTDAIIPKQFLKSIHRTGFGKNLFDSWRYLDTGYPGMDCDKRPLDMKFVMNEPKYSSASILLTRENFGCGSSREHAPWAIYEAGFKVLLAPSFADIFFNNCLKNGILPINLNEKTIDLLFSLAQKKDPLKLHVNLEKQSIADENSDFQVLFEIDDEIKKKLMDGLDEIGLTLNLKKTIEEFERQRLSKRPWLQIDPSEKLE